MVLQAPGEAEAELGYLNYVGLLDAVITEDVDSLLFKANTVLVKSFVPRRCFLFKPTALTLIRASTTDLPSRTPRGTTSFDPKTLPRRSTGWIPVDSF